MGRPSIYTDEMVEEICERLANGETITSICRDEHMPGVMTVMRWAKERDDFGTKYAHAREAQAEYMDDLILQTARATNSDNAAASRVQNDAYKWRAAKLAPKRYGEKLDITTPPEKQENLADISTRVAAIIAIGRSRMLADQSRRAEDGEYSDVGAEND